MELRDKNGLSEAEFLARYRPGNYPRPSVTADIAVLVPRAEGAEVLLIRRGGHPFLGCWALPGGFVNPDESVDAAAAREVLEETGAAGLPLEQLHTFSTPGRDPRTWVISCAYLAALPVRPSSVHAGDDAAQAAWFSAAYTRELTGGDFVYTLRLTGPGVSGTAVVRRAASGQEYAVEAPGPLAFDHAAILACALERLSVGKN